MRLLPHLVRQATRPTGKSTSFPGDRSYLFSHDHIHLQPHLSPVWPEATLPVTGSLASGSRQPDTPPVSCAAWAEEDKLPGEREH